MVSLIILKNIYHRAIILHKLIGLGKAMTPFYFRFTRLKVKGTRITFKNMYTWFLFVILRTIYHKAFIFHMLIGLDRDLTHIDIGVIRSKVKVRRITFVKIWFSLIILKTVYHRGFIFYMLDGLGEGLTSTYFLFFRSKVNITKINFVKKCFLLILLVNSYHKAVICNVLVGLGEDKSPGVLSSLGQRSMLRGSLVINYVNSFYWTF